MSMCLCAHILQRPSEVHCSHPVRLKLFNLNWIAFMLLTMVLLNLSVIYPDSVVASLCFNSLCIGPNFLLFILSFLCA